VIKEGLIALVHAEEGDGEVVCEEVSAVTD
jgi:hypothetical protein